MDICLTQCTAAAFVVYDSGHKRVMAARDSTGSQNFFWGFTTDGSLMFSCDLNDLGDCEPSATAFPSGEAGPGTKAILLTYYRAFESRNAYR